MRSLWKSFRRLLFERPAVVSALALLPLLSKRPDHRFAHAAVRLGLVALLAVATSAGAEEPADHEMRQLWRPREAPANESPGFATPSYAPEILQAAGDGRLVVRIGRVHAIAPVAPVEVVSPAGKVLVHRTASPGTELSFNTGRWADGPYEIRVIPPAINGSPTFLHILWFKGDLLAAARMLVTEARKQTAPAGSPLALTLPMLADLVTDRLGGDPAKVSAAPPGKRDDVLSALLEWADLKAGGGSHAAQVHPHGFVRLAWRDEIDDSIQFCRVYLPPHYDPAKRWPLVVRLHGFNGPNPLYINWWSVAARHNTLAEHNGVVVIEPHARGNAMGAKIGYKGIAERDVLKSIEETKRLLSIDADHVLLMGHSMGGNGTIQIGAPHPELFAALAPVASVYDLRAVAPKEQTALLTPWQRLLYMEHYSSTARAEALVNLPVFVNHGDADKASPVQFSRFFVAMLQRWGYDVRYWEHPGLGHQEVLDCEDEVVRWFLTKTRKTSPTQVRIRATELVTASAYWLRLTQRQNPFHLLQAEARVEGPDRLRLDTDNVLEVEVLPDCPLSRDRDVQVLWNGKLARSERLADGRLRLRAGAYVPTGIVKTAQREGPIAQVVTTPFAIIAGTTAPDQSTRDAVARTAENLRKAWQQDQRASPRFFTDHDVPNDVLHSCSLILVGGPSENALTHRLVDEGSLPLAVGPGRITVAGREFAADGAAMQMIWPSPWHTERLIRVLAANDPKAWFYHDTIPPVDFESVDFWIYDGRVAEKTAGLPPNFPPKFEEVVVAQGRFDWKWQLTSDGLMMGDPAVREKAARQKIPE